MNWLCGQKGCAFVAHNAIEMHHHGLMHVNRGDDPQRADVDALRTLCAADRAGPGVVVVGRRVKDNDANDWPFGLLVVAGLSFAGALLALAVMARLEAEYARAVRWRRREIEAECAGLWWGLVALCAPEILER